MTKLKSKKMTKSTFAIIIMAVVMVAMLAFGGTYAYFTATTTGVNSGALKTGTVSLKANTAATFVTSGIVSGKEIISANNISYTDASDVDVWVFVTFKATLKKGDDDTAGQLKETKDAITEEGDYFLDITYNKKAMTDESNGWTILSGSAADNSYILARKVLGTGTKDIPVCDSIKFYGKSNLLDGTTGGAIMGADLQIVVTAESIQDWSETTNDTFGNDAKAAKTAYNVLHAGTFSIS